MRYVISELGLALFMILIFWALNLSGVIDCSWWWLLLALLLIP